MKTSITRMAIGAMVAAGLLMMAACHRHDTRHHAEGRHFRNAADHIAGKLDLDPSQEKELTAMRSRFEETRRNLLNRDELYAAFTRELWKDEMDTERLQRIMSDAIRELEAVSRQMIEDVAVFHGTLTGEQKEKLARLLKQHNERSDRYR